MSGKLPRGWYQAECFFCDWKGTPSRDLAKVMEQDDRHGMTRRHRRIIAARDRAGAEGVEAFKAAEMGRRENA